MKPEPLAEIMTDSGFHFLVKQGGVGKDAVFAQITFEHKHLTEITFIGIVWLAIGECRNNRYLISDCHLRNDGRGMCRLIEERGDNRAYTGKVLVEKMMMDNSPYPAAGSYWLQDVINPYDTRKYLINVLDIIRDSAANEYLSKNDWKVFRFWEHEIQKNVHSCIKQVRDYIHNIHSNLMTYP